MAKVHLLSIAQKKPATFPYFALDDLIRLERCANNDRIGIHSLVDEPESADVILFVERGDAAGTYFEHLRYHPYFGDFPERTFVCNSRYTGIAFLPGIYGQVDKRDVVSPRHYRSGHYLEIYDKDWLSLVEQDVERTYLYSFLGAVDTCPKVRKPLLQLRHPRGIVVDTSEEKRSVENDGEVVNPADYVDRYVDVIGRSMFVLCPRGDAVSSMRLFECMRMGRAPVIIADGWVHPEGPEWDQFSITTEEKDIPSIPAILERNEDRAREMGFLARKAWEEWFAEDVYFHRITEWCLEMQREHRLSDLQKGLRVTTKLMKPYHLRSLARARYHRLKRRFANG